MDVTAIFKLLTAAGFVGVPIVTAYSGLDWYFTRNGKPTKGIFIAVAGTSSAILYSYLIWTDPAPWLIEVSIGWYFALSVFAIAVYYWLYTSCDGAVDSAGRRWILPIALLSYISLFTSAGVFSAAALARHNFLLLGGHVFAEGKAVPGGTLILEDGNHAPLRQTTCNAKGLFLIAMRYADFEAKPLDQKPAHLTVKVGDYDDQVLDLDGHPNEHLAFSFTAASAK